MTKCRKRIDMRVVAPLLIGVLAAPMLSVSASAAVIRNTMVVDFTNTPVSFGFGTSDFTLSNTGQSAYDSPVAITTSGGGEVRTIFGMPSADFDPARDYNPYNSSTTFGSFTTPTPIPYSGGPSTLGLSETIGGLTYYGYAQFHQDTLVGYAFETTAGVGIVAPVPLPGAAPMFAAALVAFGAVGYGVKRKNAKAAA